MIVTAGGVVFGGRGFHAEPLVMALLKHSHRQFGEEVELAADHAHQLHLIEYPHSHTPLHQLIQHSD